ncbi:TcpQ domain-containing protein [Cognaticolwellia aestuarii]|uniref:TcpQ domain-containing protein n=1 Tax=Cognaticolwellia aestuarii TaxID=329993 RepID=UPI000984DCBB|nr:TcpQ domain-containing protein [Cognaticolwellia aestuarii]
MNFWIRNIILAVILSGLAAALLMNQELLFSISQEAADDIAASTADVHHEEKSTPLATETARDVLRPKDTKNAAAEGLSRFYANLHGDMDEKGPKIRNNIVYLPEPRGDLKEILEAKRLVTRPLRKNWTGKTENHPFRLGETLFQKLSEYAEDNGLEIIWWLDRDFLVKDAFRINKNIITTSYQVGKAIEGHFQNGLSVYFCYQQRTIVLIEHDIPYLANECMLLPKVKR